MRRTRRPVWSIRGPKKVTLLFSFFQFGVVFVRIYVAIDWLNEISPLLTLPVILQTSTQTLSPNTVMYQHSPSDSSEYHTSQSENKAQVQQPSQIATEPLQLQRYAHVGRNQANPSTNSPQLESLSTAHFPDKRRTTTHPSHRPARTIHRHRSNLVIWMSNTLIM